MIFFSHNIINEKDFLQNLTHSLLTDERIKKIDILEIEYVKISKPIPSIIEEITHKRLKKSEFSELLKENKFEHRIYIRDFQG